MVSISIKEASIKTLGVAIKILTINSKQVTLAVFRQLMESPLIAPESAELNGIVWGRVNYFWGPCRPNHLHIVWQKEEGLFRDCTYSHSNYLVAQDWRSSIEGKLFDFMVLRSLQGWRPRNHPTYGEYQGNRQWEVSGKIFTVNCHIDCTTLWEYDSKIAPKWAKERYSVSVKNLTKYLSDREIPIDMDGTLFWSRHIQSEVDAMIRWEAKWKESYQIAADSEQLFIAV